MKGLPCCEDEGWNLLLRPGSTGISLLSCKLGELVMPLREATPCNSWVGLQISLWFWDNVDQASGQYSESRLVCAPS